MWVRRPSLNRQQIDPLIHDVLTRFDSFAPVTHRLGMESQYVGASVDNRWLIHAALFCETDPSLIHRSIQKLSTGSMYRRLDRRVVLHFGIAGSASQTVERRSVAASSNDGLWKRIVIVGRPPSSCLVRHQLQTAENGLKGRGRMSSGADLIRWALRHAQELRPVRDDRRPIDVVPTPTGLTPTLCGG